MGAYRNKSLQAIVDDIREKADYIHKTYSLQFKHRTLEEIADSYQNYLFQDHQFHTILNSDNSYIIMQRDLQRKINSIGFSQKKPTKEITIFRQCWDSLEDLFPIFKLRSVFWHLIICNAKMNEEMKGRMFFR